jgi:hypothetical protein
MATDTDIEGRAGPSAQAAETAARGNLVAGLVLIGLGVICLATALGWGSWAAAGGLWPLLLVLPGAALLLGDDRSKVVGGIVLLGLGLVCLSTSTGLLPFGSWGVVWPLFLIIPGLALLIGR